LPTIVELHETEAVPEPRRDGGDIVLQVRPEGTTSVSVMVLLNPFSLTAVIVEMPVEPTFTWIDLLEVRLKSCTTKVTGTK
jgi:hypothetical protein